MNSCRLHRAASWVFQIVAAAILLQTLWFKFTGAPESVEIFSKLGAEPWGRLASGVLELIAGGLLLHPRRAAIGGILALGLMAGAIGAHLLRLGIVVRDDGGLLFSLAVSVLGSAACVVWIRRAEIPIVGRRFAAGHVCPLPTTPS